MNVKRSVRYALASLATAAALAPIPSIAAEEAASKSKPTAAVEQLGTRIMDVSLSDGGLLTGQVFDPSLQPVVGAKVAIQTGGHTLATTTTDARGMFAVTGLRGGVHQIATGESIENCRLWAAGTAPPAAQASLKLVPGQVVRGQQYCDPCGPPCSPHPTIHQKTKAWCTNPCVVGGVVGAAIAGPILLHNLDDDHDSGS